MRRLQAPLDPGSQMMSSGLPPSCQFPRSLFEILCAFLHKHLSWPWVEEVSPASPSGSYIFSDTSALGLCLQNFSL